MPTTPDWPPRSAPRLFVTQPLSAGAQVMLEGPQAHYLARVMRAAPGDPVVLCDGLTGEWAARVVRTGKREIELLAAINLRPREQVPDFWLCPALLKKDRFDLVLEKATELGIRAIRPVLTRRCVADKLNPERARAIVVEAAEQCARTALPELAPPVKLDALLREWPADRTLFFADELGGTPRRTGFHRAYRPRRAPHRPRRRVRRCRARRDPRLPASGGHLARPAHPARRDCGAGRDRRVDGRGGRLGGDLILAQQFALT